LFVPAITGWVGGTAITRTQGGDIVPGTTAVERVSNHGYTTSKHTLSFVNT